MNVFDGHCFNCDCYMTDLGDGEWECPCCGDEHYQYDEDPYDLPVGVDDTFTIRDEHYNPVDRDDPDAFMTGATE